MMKGKKVYSKLSILIITILLLAGTQVLAASLSKVTGLRTTNITNDAVTLTWNRVSGAKGYKVYVYIPGIGYTRVSDATSTRTTISGFKAVTGWESGLNLKAKVIAFNNTGDAPAAEISFKTPRTSGGGSGGGTSSRTKPTKVTNLRASNITASSVYISWNKVTGATGYKVYIEVPGYGYSYLGVTNKTYQTITGLDSITAYKSGSNIRAKVIATNNAGDAPEALVSFKAPGNSGGGTSSRTKPTKVTNLKASNITASSVYLSWNKVTGATGYKVYIEVPGYGYSYIGVVNTTYTTIRGLDSITAYKSGSNIRAKVIATNNAGDAPEVLVSFKAPGGSSSRTKPARVTGLRATNITNDAVTLVWNSVTGAKGYKVYVNIPGLGYVYVRDVKTTNATVSGFTAVTGNDAGLNYKAKIIAFNDAGDGPESAEVTFRTPKSSASAPAKVTGLRATNITNDAVTLVWNSVTGAKGYKVYVNIPGLGYVYVRDVKTTNATVSGFTAVTGNDAGLNYKAKIIAFNDAGDGPESAEVSFKTPAKAVAVGKVAGLSINPGTTTADISWNTVAGATKYEIYVNNQSKGFCYKNSATLTGLKKGITYKVKVRAFIGNTAGEFSDEKSFTAKNTSSPSPNPGTTKPAKVTGLQIIKIEKNSVKVKFNAVSGADGYIIYADQKNGSNHRFVDVKNNEGTVTGLSAETTYIIHVVAYKNNKNNCGNSSDSKEVTTSIDAGKIASIGTMTVTTNSVRVVYTPQGNETPGYTRGYEIQIRKENETFTNCKKYTTTASTGYTCQNLTPATKYYVRVVPYKIDRYDHMIYGTPSATKSFTTLRQATQTSTYKVQNVQLTKKTNTSIMVKWDKLDYVEGYTVYIKQSTASKYTKYQIIGKQNNYKIISGLEAGKTYDVEVRVIYYDASGRQQEGPASDRKSISLASQQNNTPAYKAQNVKATIRTNTSIMVEWKKVDYAEGYVVYIKQATASKYDRYQVTGRGTTYRIISSLEAGKKYEIQVKATYYDASGRLQEGPASNTVYVTMPYTAQKLSR